MAALEVTVNYYFQQILLASRMDCTIIYPRRQSILTLIFSPEKDNEPMMMQPISVFTPLLSEEVL